MRLHIDGVVFPRVQDGTFGDAKKAELGTVADRSSEKLLVVVGCPVHLRSALRLLILRLTVLQEGDTGSFVIYWSVRTVIYVSVVQIGELRLERLRGAGKTRIFIRSSWAGLVSNFQIGNRLLSTRDRVFTRIPQFQSSNPEFHKL